MKFELELEGYNTMPYKTQAIANVLQRELGGSWKVKQIPAPLIPYDMGQQVSDFVQFVKDKAPK